MQDDYYLKKEADDFFLRWSSNANLDELKNLRDSKADILNKISDATNLQNKSILEVGCFIGDLLAVLRDDYGCSVKGIEPSNLACEYALQKFSLELENQPYYNSSQFKLDKDHHHIFDGIILDDVLSWMSRDVIIPVLGSLDWSLKPGGFIFLRDFCPSFSFRYPNHHCVGQDVFNFKQSNGHKSFFINSGKYLEEFTITTNTKEYQLVETTKQDSALWCDTVLIKVEEPLHPLLSL